ncbi:MAG: hypothetical protein ACLSE8_03150 [Parasutterella sp.]
MFIFIGFILLIGLIFATFYVYLSPSDEEISRYQERLEKEEISRYQERLEKELNEKHDEISW